MKSQPDLDDLISAWLDSRIDESEKEQLENLLKASEGARIRFIQLSQQDSALREIAATLEVSEPVGEGVVQNRAQTNSFNNVSWFWKLGWIGFAAMAIILLIVHSTETIENPRIRMTFVEGPTQFQASDSTMESALKVGENFSGGTFHLHSQDSKVGLEFFDETSCYTWGIARYHIENSLQKRISADYGQFVLDVQPQPDNLPFLFKTQNAELTVIGTSFMVTATAELTSLVVFDGEVVVKRLLDGTQQMVPTGNRIIIHTGETGPLGILELSKTTYNWTADFSKSLYWGRFSNEEESGIIQNKSANSVYALPTPLNSNSKSKNAGLNDRIELFVMNRYSERVLLGQNSSFLISGSLAPGLRVELQFLLYDAASGRVRSFFSSRSNDQNKYEFHFELPVLEFMDLSNGPKPFGSNMVGQELIQLNIFTTGPDSQLSLNNVQLISK